MQVEGRVCGLLLAGGQSRRMGGGDKCLQKLGGKSLLARVIKCARPQVDHIILNANGDVGRFDSYGLKVVKDVVDGFAGPLAGILTGLEWVRENQPECHWVASFACDAPFAPGDLVSRLSEAIAEKKGTLVCARSTRFWSLAGGLGRRSPLCSSQGRYSKSRHLDWSLSSCSCKLVD